ncbi:hypothetical protein CAPN002_25880 [Capnocytophaga stomatis]|uniref:hypothetical protein n=1 Tax=Capnocytophaga stomatis TaxID=1848904 RepID=UPI0019529145|nr:hypothetical protein [Capnocytophaga stomatis]GIJ95370.1 hypothetical protein CAPN002_25880 [Capnocytophaga stomatis]
MKKIILFSAIVLFIVQVKGQEESFSIDMLNSEIKRTMEENERQKELTKKQTLSTTLETNNKEQWKKYKQTVKKIQERLQIVDFALQAIPSGYIITQKTKNIKYNQERIIQELKIAPYAIKNIVTQQLKFVDDLQMVTRLIVGIVVSYGSINQMERAERKILIDYALKEVERLDNDSFGMLMIIQTAKEASRRRKGIFDFYINRDKEIIQDIFKNIKKL